MLAPFILSAVLLLAASPASATTPAPLTPAPEAPLSLEIAPYSHVNVLYHVGERAGRSLFRSKHGGKPSQSAADPIHSFRRIHDEHLARRMAFRGQPAQRNETALDLRRLFWWHAARSVTWQQFKDATFPLLPADQHGELFAAIGVVAPQGAPAQHRAAVAAYRKALNLELARSAPLIAKMRQFYGSVWPQDKPFYIHLLPKAKLSSMTMATIVADRILLEVPPKPKPERAKRDMTVILHELAHGLYGSQPLSLMNHLDQHFTKEPSLASNGTYKLIDEAMATAIGNAMGYKLLLNRLPPKPWYNNHGIDALAHAILPLVERYLANGKTIDEAFVGEAITLYRRMMGDELYRLDVLLKDVVLAVSGELSLAECKSQLKEVFPSIAGVYQSRPITAPETRETIETAMADLVPVVLVYKTPEELRRTLEGIMPKPLLADLWASPAQVWSAIAPGDRVFIGMQVRTAADVADLLSPIKKVGTLPQELRRYR